MGVIFLKPIATLFAALWLSMSAVGCAAVYDVSYDYNTRIDLNRLKTFGWLRLPEKDGILELDIVRIRDAVAAELEAKGLRQAMVNPDFLVALYIKIEEKINFNRWGYAPYPGYGRYDPYATYRLHGYYPGYRGYGPYRGYRGHVPYRRYGAYGLQPEYRSFRPYPGYSKFRSYPNYRRYYAYPGLRRNGPAPYRRYHSGVTVTRYQEGTLILDFVDPVRNEVIWQGAAKSLVDGSMDTQNREKHINDAVQKILENFPPSA
jgi:hypothetical protein